jgi:UDP-N-acetylglucosamine 4,6-dehydratase
MIKLPEKIDWLDNAVIFITGGTGSLGNKLTRIILKHSNARKIIIFSRDEFKQFQMQQIIPAEHQSRVRFFLGDVRDKARLMMALDGVDFVIHTSALKQVPAAEYNPFEFIKTNVLGAENVISSSLDCGVKKVVALSTDKAVNPVNLYGATKLCSDKLFTAANNYSGKRPTRFSVVRYGNVVGSRGSVVPFFLKKRKEGVLPITDERMTRFWITLEQGAALVLNAFRVMQGGEVFVPKIPSMRMVDLAKVIAPEAKHEIIGIRPGEKLHEVMIPADDAYRAFEYATHYLVMPGFQFWQDADKHSPPPGGKKCPDGFYYGSNNNTQWLKEEDLALMIAALDLPEAKEWAKEKGIKTT